MNFSSQTSQPAPAQSLLKINTGSLLDSLDTETQARVLEQRFIEQPLVIAENPYAKLIQKALMQQHAYFDLHLCLFIRPQATRGTSKIGPMGCVKKRGYRVITLRNQSFYQSHIVYLWFTGKLPESNMQMDHIDGNTLNDYPGNLRCVSHAINHRNNKIDSRNTSGCTGVDFHSATGGWRARCANVHLGIFYSKELAIKARQEYLNQNPKLGYTTRHGT